MALAFSSSESTIGRLSTGYSPAAPSFDPQQVTFKFPNSTDELQYLRQQSEQLSTIIDGMPTGMIMLDGDGVVVRANKIAKALLDEPIIGQKWFNVITRSFQPRADDWHEVSLKDGRRVKLEISALENQPGQLIMITDLTETRLLQGKMAQMQRLSSLGRLVSTLAHQIRTPLSAAMLYGANLKNKKITEESRNNFQDKLMSRLEDLEQQVNDMLLFAKSGNEQVVEALSVNAVVEQSVQSVEALIAKSKATVTVETCVDDCQILGNKRALTSAIQNLIHNSLELIEHDALINVRVHCSTDMAFISVQDNGKGISADMADKIFEPFYTARSQGTGLGLAVVKSVANAHKGDVTLLSHSGKGAHFCIHIPLLIDESVPLDKSKQDLEKVREMSLHCEENINEYQ